MSSNSIVAIYTQSLLSTQSASSGLFTRIEEHGQTPSTLARSARNPLTVSRLFPSMHTLSSLSSIRDPSRYSGKQTTHFEDDVGLLAIDSAHIGQGFQFDVRRVKLCCDRGFYVQKSALSAAYRKRATRESREQQEAAKRLIQAVFLEYRALSHPPIRGHPNVVDILDLAWETDPENRRDKWPVLILEYADRGTMTTFLGQSQFSLETRAKLCLDVANGLAVLHDSGVIHGDLNMNNVLIFTNSGVNSASVNKYTAKLADFGASSAELDTDHFRLYTKPWNAPECFEVLDLTGLKMTDIYSFGLLCWSAILGGRNPFRAVEAVSKRLSPEDWDASLERLKKRDGGAELLRLAQESFSAAFGHLKAPAIVIETTLQLDPSMRDLSKAVTAWEEFLNPLRTEDEAKEALKKPAQLLGGPRICSHAVSPQLRSRAIETTITAGFNQQADWVQESGGKPVAAESPQEDDRVARCLLAELELNDWLDCRSPDPSKAITQYLAMKSRSIWETAILYRLASRLPDEEFQEVFDAIRDDLTAAFFAGFMPVQHDVFLRYPNWVTEQIGFALVCNNSAQSLNPKTYNILTDPGQTDVSTALRQAFPDLAPTAVTDRVDSGDRLSPDVDIDFTSVVLDRETGDLAVHILSRVGAAGLLEQLLKTPGADLDARNLALETPLLVACRAGRFATAMLLVEKGADVSLASTRGENPLHWLSSFRFFPEQMKDLARAILTRGTRDLLTAEASYKMSWDVPEHDAVTGTPVCWAIVKSCEEAARTLWKMECEAFAPARPGYEAIRLAAQLHSHSLLDVFLQGPDDLIHPESGVSLLYHVLTSMGSLSDSSVGRVLRHGVGCGQSGVETLKVLRKYGAQDHFARIPGIPECHALSLAAPECTPQVVEFILEEMGGAEFVNVDAPPPGISLAAAAGKDTKFPLEHWKQPPLAAALLFDRRRVFELLLKHGADVNRVVSSEYGPLTVLHKTVVATREPTYSKMLLATGRIDNVDQTAADFESPFATAVRMRKFDIAECLLAQGADVNHLSVNGVLSFPVDGSPVTVLAKVLLEEASLSSLACVSFLLKTGKASPYANTALNLTVLHSLAIRTSTAGGSNEDLGRRAFHRLNDEFRFSKEILNLRNSHGSTALENAVHNGKAALVEELLAAGAEWGVVLPNPTGSISPLEAAMKRLFLFPQGVRVEGDCPPKEKQLDEAFVRQRHICYMLCRKARERARESQEPVP